MTTYAFHLTVREGTELGVLTEALDLYIKHCQDEIDKENRWELYDNLQTAKEIKSKIYQGMVQTSGNNFFDNKE